MSQTPTLRNRSVRAEIRRAKRDILHRTSLDTATRAIADHRDGDHHNPEHYQHVCYACLAWCRRHWKQMRINRLKGTQPPPSP